MEMDTSELFDSPILIREELDNEHSIIEWRPDIQEMVGVVYYWRIAPLSEDRNLKSSQWQTSSFVYEPNGPYGWHQSHYYQWQKDELYKNLPR